MGLGVAIGVIGVLFLSHAAYSTIQYIGLLKITEDELSGPPLNVVLELLLGFMLCAYAALSVPGKFLPISPDSEENRLRIGSVQNRVWLLCCTIYLSYQHKNGSLSFRVTTLSRRWVAGPGSIQEKMLLMQMGKQLK